MVRKGRLWHVVIIFAAAVGLLLGTTHAVSAKKKCPKKIVFGQVIALSGPLAGGVAISGGKIYQLWIEQVNKAVTEMDKVTQQNAANAEESASASEELSSQAASMNEIIGELTALVGSTK